MATLLPFSLGIGNDKKKSALDILRAPTLTFAGTTNQAAKTPQPQANTNTASQQSPAMSRALQILQQKQPAPLKPQTLTTNQFNQPKTITANQMSINSAKITAPTLQAPKITEQKTTEQLRQELKSRLDNMGVVKKTAMINSAAKRIQEEGQKKLNDYATSVSKDITRNSSLADPTFTAMADRSAINRIQKETNKKLENLQKAVNMDNMGQKNVLTGSTMTFDRSTINSTDNADAARYWSKAGMTHKALMPIMGGENTVDSIADKASQMTYSNILEKYNAATGDQQADVKENIQKIITNLKYSEGAKNNDADTMGYITYLSQLSSFLDNYGNYKGKSLGRQIGDSFKNGAFVGDMASGLTKLLGNVTGTGDKVDKMLENRAAEMTDLGVVGAANTVASAVGNFGMNTVFGATPALLNAGINTVNTLFDLGDKKLDMDDNGQAVLRNKNTGEIVGELGAQAMADLMTIAAATPAINKYLPNLDPAKNATNKLPNLQELLGYAKTELPFAVGTTLAEQGFSNLANNKGFLDYDLGNVAKGFIGNLAQDASLDLVNRGMAMGQKPVGQEYAEALAERAAKLAGDAKDFYDTHKYDTLKGTKENFLADAIAGKNKNTDNIKQKEAQLALIQKTNPMTDDYHTGIRTVDDIKTFDEVMKGDYESEGYFSYPDWEFADAKKMMDGGGKVTVYSSHPIKDGTFVTPSKMMAADYAGGPDKQLYSKTIDTSEVAWINGDEGQFTSKSSLDTSKQKTASLGSPQQEMNLATNSLRASSRPERLVNNTATKAASNSAGSSAPVSSTSEATIKTTLSQNSGKVKESNMTVAAPSGERRQSKFATETATTSGELSGAFKKKLRSDANSGKGATYEAATDAGTIKQTESFMKKNLKQAEAEITERLNVKPGQATKQDISDALAVVKKLEAKGDSASFERAEQIIDKISEHASKSGQAIQALTLLSNKTPEGILYGATKTLKKAGVEVTPEIRQKLQGNIKQIVEKRANVTRAQADLDAVSQKFDSLISGSSSDGLSTTQMADKQRKTDQPSQQATKLARETQEYRGEKSATRSGLTNQKVEQGLSGRQEKQSPSRTLGGEQYLRSEASSDKSFGAILQQIKEKGKLVQKANDELSYAYGTLGKTVANARPQKVADMYSTIVKGNMLSAPTTHIKNITSNSTFRALSKISDLISVPIDKLASVFTNKRSRTFTMRGEGEGLRKGLEYAATTMRTGLDEMDGSGQKYSSGTSELHFDNKLADIIIGKPNRIIFRAMSAGDKPFRYGAQTNKLYELATISAREQKLTGQAKEAYIQKFVYDPPADALSKAIDAGEKAVLGQQNEVASAISGFVQKNKNSDNVGVKLVATYLDSHVVPFVKVPTNFLIESMRYHPATASAMEIAHQVSAIKSGKGFDQESFSTNVGKLATGSAVLWLGQLLADSITGGYPDDQKERNRWEAEGVKENSLKVGNTYIPLEAFGPASLLMGAGATYKRQLESGSGGLDAATASLSEMAQRLTDQSFLTGISEATQVLQGGDVAGAGTTYLRSNVSSWVPNIVRKAATATDEYQRKYAKDNPAKAILQGVTAGIPGLRQATMDKKVDVYGNELKNGSFMTSFIDPTNSSRELKPDDEMIKEVARLYEVSKQDGWESDDIATLKATPDKVKTSFGPSGSTIKLTDSEQRELQKMVGQRIQDQYRKTMATDKYKDATDIQKAQMLKDARQAATNLAQQEFGQQKGYQAPKMTTDAKNLSNGTFTANYSGETSKSINVNAGIASNHKEVLTRYQGMSSEEWNKYLYDNKSAEYELALAKYENSKANGELTNTQIVNKEKELRKLKVSKDYDKSVREVYGLAGTRADIQAALNLAENNDERKAIVDELNKLNRAMYDAGVINATTYKTRNRNINNFASSRSSGRSSKKSSSSSEKTFKTPESGPGFTALLNAIKGSGTTDANKGNSSKKPTLKAANRKSNVIGNYVNKISKTNLGSDPKITRKKG